MFGYVRADRPNLYIKDDVLYKAMYCGVCKGISAVCGQRARMGLSYDITFLSVILHNIKGVDVKIEKSHCLTHRIRSKPMAEVDELRLAGLNELLDFTAGMKVMICVENMTTGRYMSTSESLLNFIHSADRKNVGICLDTGHLNIRKMEEHEDFIRACGKDLQALHIADNNGGWDEHLMPFSGTVNWKKTVAALEEIGYDRLVNFEVPGSSWRICNGDAELRDQFLPFARLLGEKLFGGLK